MSEEVAEQQIEEVYKRVSAAAEKSGRDASQVKVIAVSKAQSIERVEAFLASKKKYWALGESYLNEMVEKQKHFQTKNLEWHFLGRLQSRKIPEICSSVSVIHGVSRIKELEILQKDFPKQEFYLQINTSEEVTKAGLARADFEKIFDGQQIEKRDLAAIDKIKDHLLSTSCLGLMCMPSQLAEVGEAGLRKELQQLKFLRDQFLVGKELNMGTSNDFEVAIEEGSDVLRLGSCLFGARDYSS